MASSYFTRLCSSATTFILHRFASVFTSYSSFTATCFEGLVCEPLNFTLPVSQAVAAPILILNKRIAQRYLSRRSFSLASDISKKSMQRSIIICFCLLALAVSGQNRNAAPKVKDVVKKFYSQYTMDPLVDPNTEYPYVAFEKRQEGWYVVTQKLNKDNNHYSLEPVDKFLFYDNRFQKYKPLSFAKITHPKQVNPADYFDEYT